MRDCVPITFARSDREHFAGRDLCGLTYKRASWSFDDPNMNPAMDTHLGADECSVGLPFRCVIGRCAYRFPTSSAAAQEEFDAVNAWASRYDQTPLSDFLASLTNSFAPGTILVAPLVANLCLWSATALGLLATCSTIRTVRRIASGRCAACGFDLAGLTKDRCPECGKTIGNEP